MILPEEAILTRAVKDAIAFVNDSRENPVDKLLVRSREAASEASGVELQGEAVRKLYTSVFLTAVAALVEWDFATGSEHR